MRKALLATLALGVSVSTASAAPLQLRGSDTLFKFTVDMIDRCVPDITAAEMTYKGGGSTLGETEMETGNQQIAPMSRFIDAASCSGSHTRVCDADLRDNNGNGTVDETGELCGVATGCKVALDGIGVYMSDNAPNTCSTMRYSGTMTVEDLNGIAGIDDGSSATTPVIVPGSYDFSDWRDALRIIYGGQMAHKTADSCAELAPGRSGIAEKRCNSDVRHTLVKRWGNLFEEGTACTTQTCTTDGFDNNANGTVDEAGEPCCTELRHAFRRDDVSGTTDVFLELLALPAITTTPFCNGAEMEDEDPVRRKCAMTSTAASNTAGQWGYEQVCNATAKSLLGQKSNGFQSTFGTFMNPGWYGGGTVDPGDAFSADLGLVLPVVIPPVDPYLDTNFCSFLAVGGSKAYATMPIGGILPNQLRCPDGTARVGGKCQWPVRVVGGVNTFGCVNKRENLPGGAALTKMDGRVYNLIPRNADGSVQTVPRVDALDLAGGQPEYNVELHHAFYRIHETVVMPHGVADAGITGCRSPDATEQIGCLVHANPCSMGLAGLAANTHNPNKPLALRTPRGTTKVCAADGIDNNNNGTVDEAGELCDPGIALQPDPTFIRRLNDPTSTTAGACATAGNFDIRYPLARNLWLNAIAGFETLADPDRDYDNITNTRREQDLIKCACDRFYADASAAVGGFVTLSTLSAGQCTAPGQSGVCQSEVRSCP